MDSLIRRIAFWCLDIIKGGKVLKNVKEIKKVINAKESNQKQLAWQNYWMYQQIYQRS